MTFACFPFRVTATPMGPWRPPCSRPCRYRDVHVVPVRGDGDLERHLALRLDSAEYRSMRETAMRTGWLHILDANRVYDLDRDPNTTMSINTHTPVASATTPGEH